MCLWCFLTVGGGDRLYLDPSGGGEVCFSLDGWVSAVTLGTGYHDGFGTRRRQTDPHGRQVGVKRGVYYSPVKDLDALVGV